MGQMIVGALILGVGVLLGAVTIMVGLNLNKED